jgi:signal peptidase I
MFSGYAIIFDILVFIVWPGHYIYQEFLSSARARRRRGLKMLAAQALYRWRWDRDRFADAQCATLTEIREEALAYLKQPDDEKAIEAFLEESVARLKKLSRKSKSRLGREWLELLVVVVGVVMGIRALFLQPFKIPTGSMQPTLHGINFVEQEKVEPNWFQRIMHYANGSRRYTDVAAERPGKIYKTQADGLFMVTRKGRELAHEMYQKNPLLFFPYTSWHLGGVPHNLPGEKGNVHRYIVEYRLDHYPDDPITRHNEWNNIKAGQTILRGYLELGDHLFVNRIAYNFTEPQRGDITVFVTDGLRFRGKPLRGRFFIKRLVGIPGDTLRIRDRRLEVKVKGSDEFVVVDGSFAKAFDRMYSFKGGYRGYSHESGANYLLTDTDTVTLGPDEYWLQGDNTESSQDSRFWGAVPRRNIVGRADFVYWPFTRRWGITDLADPEE